MMNEFEFTLDFDLSNQVENPEKYIDALYEAGCSDAIVGIGQAGRISLRFIRKSISEAEAMSSAIENVKRAIPNIRLVTTQPLIK